jgi:hypothetical protein
MSASLIIAKLSSLVKNAAPGTTVTVSFEAFTRSGSTCVTCTFIPWHGHVVVPNFFPCLC